MRENRTYGLMREGRLSGLLSTLPISKSYQWEDTVKQHVKAYNKIIADRKSREKKN